MRNTIAVEQAKMNLVLEGMSYDDYAKLDAVNAHGLMDIIQSPAAYQYGLTESSKPTPSMQLGLHVDMALFEPMLFASQVIPKSVSKDVKWEHEIVTDLHFNKVLKIVEAVRGNETARELLMSGGVPQPVVAWDDRFHRVPCKARLDFIAKLGGRQVAVDLKTTADASPDGFGRQIANYRYDLQAAHYLEAARATGKFDPEVFLFIAVQNKPPYDCFVYRAGETVLSNGVMWRDYAMQIYAECRRHDHWPGPPSYQTIEMPYWAKPPQEEQGAGMVAPDPPPPEDDY